ncbi:MAG: saccharopine dehydrogenase NADP-binding domain-containing protein [Bernardetiaceae bacterium]|nr:saccharopine dehydrogenase NADP-binding domain-containing protein [Bernardetiaceae bacterium]
MKNFLIYGAYGYTGELIVEESIKRGLKPILAGRHAQKLKAVAERFSLEAQSFSLDDKEKLYSLLRRDDICAVLHAAGPYIHTYTPMVEACLQTGCHYIDITGEIDVFERISSLDKRAERAGIMLLPGAGFDVVPSDCLAAYAASQISHPEYLEIAFKGIGGMSRGTTLTMLENLDEGGRVRHNGKIIAVRSAHAQRQINELSQKSPSVSIPWGDVSTAYHSTGIENIIVYMTMPESMQRSMNLSNYAKPLLGLSAVKNLLGKVVRARVSGPDATARAEGHSLFWAEVRNSQDEVFRAMLRTPEGYTLTALTAVAITERVLKGDYKIGFQTPSRAYGADFILEFEGTERIVL